VAEQQQLIELTADIVSAHVANNSVAVGDVANLVQRVHEALSGLGQAPAMQEPQKKEPVVSVRASVKPDYIVCMECGKRQKTLKRHLQTAHGMTPQQYRSDYGLPDSYSMVSAEYAQMRRDMANSIGLGRKKSDSVKAPASAQDETPPKRRGLSKKAEATTSPA
jgi:predicted transcriptional regulator